jgi:hypothetical protein
MERRFKNAVLVSILLRKKLWNSELSQKYPCIRASTYKKCVNNTGEQGYGNIQEICSINTNMLITNLGAVQPWFSSSTKL